MMSKRLRITDELSLYKFKFAKEIENSNDIIFINENDVLCRIYDLDRFEFIYTNDCMLGMLTSGIFEIDKLSNGQFEQILIEFTETVNKLKDAYGV